MELRTREPFWLRKNASLSAYPFLEENIDAEVCIVGAGITGALAAHALVRSGVSVVVVDKRHPGMGSTAASTALLQYEIDEPLRRLGKTVGPRRAAESYRACYEAVDTLARLVADERIDADFRSTPSLQYASRTKDVAGLRKEYQARLGIGLEVEWLEAGDIRYRYGFSAPGALWSKRGAQVDAFRLARQLLERGRLDGKLRVFDTVRVVGWDAEKKAVTVQTDAGSRIRARHVVIACGYESQKFLPARVVELSSTYALASKPLPESSLWKDRCLLWETKTPYMYVRTTGDNRIITGGRDDAARWKRRRFRLRDKTKGLVADVRKLWPDLAVRPDCAWAGAFGGTKDSLPYVGNFPDFPRVHYILGYGGNGIVFSQTGAEVVRDAILGRKNPRAALYSFDR